MHEKDHFTLFHRQIHNETAQFPHTTLPLKERSFLFIHTTTLRRLVASPPSLFTPSQYFHHQYVNFTNTTASFLRCIHDLLPNVHLTSHKRPPKLATFSGNSLLPTPGRLVPTNDRSPFYLLLTPTFCHITFCATPAQRLTSLPFRHHSHNPLCNAVAITVSFYYFPLSTDPT